MFAEHNVWWLNDQKQLGSICFDGRHLCFMRYAMSSGPRHAKRARTTWHVVSSNLYLKFGTKQIQDGGSLTVHTFKERFLRFQLLFPDFYHFHHVIWEMEWAKKLKTKNGQNTWSGPFSHDAAQVIETSVSHWKKATSKLTPTLWCGLRRTYAHNHIAPTTWQP